MPANPDRNCELKNHIADRRRQSPISTNPTMSGVTHTFYSTSNRKKPPGSKEPIPVQLNCALEGMSFNRRFRAPVNNTETIGDLKHHTVELVC